jgi:hypothetical protein
MVPHDPAKHARLSYAWRDATFHLVTEPSPLVLLISNTVSQGTGYETAEKAEAAFWEAVVAAILAKRTYQNPCAMWPGVEIAVVPDPASATVHLAERTSRGCKAAPLPSSEAALDAYLDRLLELITASRRN